MLRFIDAAAMMLIPPLTLMLLIACAYGHTPLRHADMMMFALLCAMRVMARDKYEHAPARYAS